MSNNQQTKQLTNGAVLPAQTASPINVGVDYEAAVAEGKQIITRRDQQERRDQMRLGELGDQIDKKYKKRAEFAREIGIAPCTLMRCMSVFRAWQGKEAPEPVSFAVLKALQDHPDREAIVQANPKLTKSEAHDKMRQYKAGNDGQVNNEGQEKNTKKAEAPADWQTETKRWFRQVVTIANSAVGAAAIGPIGTMTPERKRALLAVVEPNLLPPLKEAGEALIKLFDDLKQLIEQNADWDQAEEAAAPEVPLRPRTRNPEQAKNKARKQAQHDAMEYDLEDAKAEAKENGERWGDIKDEWIEQWIADNWGDEQEAEFEKDFQEQGARRP